MTKLRKAINHYVFEMTNHPYQEGGMYIFRRYNGAGAPLVDAFTEVDEISGLIDDEVLRSHANLSRQALIGSGVIRPLQKEALATINLSHNTVMCHENTYSKILTSNDAFNTNVFNGDIFVVEELILKKLYERETSKNYLSDVLVDRFFTPEGLKMAFEILTQNEDKDDGESAADSRSDQLDQNRESFSLTQKQREGRERSILLRKCR